MVVVDVVFVCFLIFDLGIVFLIVFRGFGNGVLLFFGFLIFLFIFFGMIEGVFLWFEIVWLLGILVFLFVFCDWIGKNVLFLGVDVEFWKVWWFYVESFLGFLWESYFLVLYVVVVMLDLVVFDLVLCFDFMIMKL